jgi:AcrR family transcriptional regulator
MRASGRTQAVAQKRAPNKRQRSASQAAVNGGGVTANMREEVAAYRKDLILRAAVDAFFEHGYHDCTVDMIAERLSGTKAIVYYYFADKHSILQEIYRRALETALDLYRKAAEENKDPVSRLAGIARYYAQWVIENQRVVGVIWREERALSADARAAVVAERKRMDDLISVVIRDGVSKGVFDVVDPGTTARAIEGMITFTWSWWRSDRRLSREETADYYARMALRLAGARA